MRDTKERTERQPHLSPPRLKTLGKVHKETGVCGRQWEQLHPTRHGPRGAAPLPRATFISGTATISASVHSDKCPPVASRFVPEALLAATSPPGPSVARGRSGHGSDSVHGIAKVTSTTVSSND